MDVQPNKRSEETWDTETMARQERCIRLLVPTVGKNAKYRSTLLRDDPSTATRVGRSIDLRGENPGDTRTVAAS